MVDSVRRWLKQRGLEKYADSFIANDVALDVFSQLTEDDLRDLGLTMGDRKRFLLAVGAQPVAVRWLSETVLDSLPGLFAYVLSDGTYAYVNSLFEDWYGRSVEDILGKTLKDVMSPQSYAQVEPYLRAALAGESSTFEIDTVLYDGRTAWSRVQYVPDIALSGEVRGFFAMVSDLSDLYEATSKLEDSERRYRELIEGALQGIIIRDEHDGLLFANQAIADMFGYESAADVLALGSFEPLVAEPEARAVQRERRRRFMAGENIPAELEYKARRRDGTHFWVLSQSRLIEWLGRRAVQITILDISAQKSVEDALRKSEQRFRDFAETASDWLWEMDADLRFTFVSDSSVARLGWPSDAILGRKKSEVYEDAFTRGSDTERENWRSHLADIEAHRSFSKFLQRWVTPDGEDRFILNSGRPVYSDTAEFLGYRGTASNVTDLWEAREALRSTERLYQALLEATPAIVVKLTSEAEIDYINPFFEKLSGFRLDEVRGKNWFDLFIPARHRARFRMLFDQSLPDSSSRKSINPTLMKGGGERIIQWSDATIHDTDGTVSGVLAVGIDVTEHMQAQKALAANERRYRALIEGHAMAVLVFDEMERPLFANQSAALMFGYSSVDEIMALQSFWPLLDESELERSRKRREDRIAGRTPPPQHEFKGRRADGTPIWVLARTVSIDWDGEPARMSTFTDVTERREADQRLQQQTALLNAIVDNVPALISLKDRNGRYRYVNRMLTKVFGRPGSEFQGRLTRDMGWPSSAISIDKLAQEVIRTGKPLRNYELEVPIGSGRSYLTSILPLEHQGTDVEEVLTIAIDISRQRRTQSELRDSEARLIEAQRIGNMGNWERDAATGILSWSDEVYRIFGLDPETFEPTHEGLGNRVHPDDRDVIRQSMRRAEVGAVPNIMEYRIVRPDGEIRFVRESAEYRRDGDGNLIRAVGIIQDITDVRQAERALRESEAQLGAVMEHSPFSVMLKDIDGGIRFVNGTYEKWFGRSRDELVGRRSVSHDIERLQNRHAVENLETVLFADGSEHIVRFTEFPVLDADGEIVGIGSIGVDETERRRLEERLRQGEKLHAIGQLAGGIAHEFNNMMQVIQGNVELLSDELQADETTGRRLGAMERTAQRGGELTERLLMFSRRQTLQPRPLKIAALVDDATELLSQVLGERIELDTEVCEEIWSINSDPGELQNAIVNLAINARDAMPDGGRITLRCENLILTPEDLPPGSDIAPGPFVKLSVSDEGVGMSAAVRAQAFEPFFTTKPVGEGTGLGLSMVYGFARQSGGFAEIESAPGAHATISIFLPRYDCENGSVSGSRVPAESRQFPAGARILVVEDDDAVQVAICDALRSRGYSVDATGSGEAALALLAAGGGVDLVICDIVMPGTLDGYALFRRIKDRWRHTLVVLMSGAPDARPAGQGGGEASERLPILYKPFSIDALTAAVSNALSERR